MKYANEIKNQLQAVIDILCKAKMFQLDAMTKAQQLGLQGEKRRMRYESAKNHNLINFFVCDSFDVYGITVKVNPSSLSMPSISNIKEYFETCNAMIESQYDTLHGIANQLVAYNCQHEAKLLYDKCRCLIEDIKYYRRTIQEGDIVGWKPEFILLHQTTACNIHDEFEKKEAEIGYNF
jgi:hypothetical protein